jgi:hypothetical protein
VSYKTESGGDVCPKIIAAKKRAESAEGILLGKKTQSSSQNNGEKVRLFLLCNQCETTI